MNVSHYPAGQIASSFFASNPANYPNNLKASSSPYPFPPFSRAKTMITNNRYIDSFSTSESNPAHHFPQRLFAFASDLGFLGAFLKLPVFAWIGWLIAMPYYAITIIREPDKQSRKEEALYQATANSVLPLLEAKLGVVAGKKLSDASKHSNSLLPKLSLPAYKAMGGLLTLLVLTPTIGDKLSRKIVSYYREKAA